MRINACVQIAGACDEPTGIVEEVDVQVQNQMFLSADTDGKKGPFARAQGMEERMLNIALPWSEFKSYCETVGQVHSLGLASAGICFCFNYTPPCDHLALLPVSVFVSLFAAWLPRYRALPSGVRRLRPRPSAPAFGFAPPSEQRLLRGRPTVGQGPKRRGIR